MEVSILRESYHLSENQCYLHKLLSPLVMSWRSESDCVGVFGLGKDCCRLLVVPGGAAEKGGTFASL